jgi:hypothetical protein
VFGASVPAGRSNRTPGGGWTVGGQAMVEFAMVVGVFLLLLLTAVSASVYTVQRSAAVTAVAAAARVAAGGGRGATGANTPDLVDALATAVRVMSRVMVGTRLRQLPPSSPCPPLSSIPSREVDVCATTAGDMVTVRVRGRPAGPLSLAGLDWSLDVVARAHAVTFAP